MSEDLKDRYANEGHVVIRGAAPAQVAKNLLSVIHGSLTSQPGLLAQLVSKPRVNVSPGYEFYGYKLPSVMAFHWALTSRVAAIAGKSLLPTFVFFRVYMKGDRLLVHSDRESCEHSLSFCLGYSDDIVWPLEIGERRHDYKDVADRPKEDDFDEPYKSVALNPGDGLFYHGVNYRHGRVTPNPNRWSAHLFFFWVDADGPHAEFAFDKMEFPNKPDFPPVRG